MRKFHELVEDDPVWTANQPLTVGAMSKALADVEGRARGELVSSPRTLTTSTN